MEQEIYYNDPRGKRNLLDVICGSNAIALIVTYGSHPCIYISLNKSIDIDLLDVHGGVTFEETSLDFGKFKLESEQIIGWDYAHAGDFTYFGDSYICFGHEWNMFELRGEARDALKQIDKILQEK